MFSSNGKMLQIWYTLNITSFKTQVNKFSRNNIVVSELFGDVYVVDGSNF